MDRNAHVDHQDRVVEPRTPWGQYQTFQLTAISGEPSVLISMASVAGRAMLDDESRRAIYAVHTRTRVVSDSRYTVLVLT